MDAVAEQFVAELDAATDMLPKSVLAGLAMCGSDVVPALVERVLDVERSVATRSYSAAALAHMKAPEGWEALLDVVCSGEMVMVPMMGELISAGGAGAAQAAMARAEQPSPNPDLRCVLAGLAVRAGGAEWATPRASKIAIELVSEAPRSALTLMKMAPSELYAPVLRADPDLVRFNPEAALQVMTAHEPAGETYRVLELLTQKVDEVLKEVSDLRGRP